MLPWWPPASPRLRLPLGVQQMRCVSLLGVRDAVACTRFRRGLTRVACSGGEGQGTNRRRGLHCHDGGTQRQVSSSFATTSAPRTEGTMPRAYQLSRHTLSSPACLWRVGECAPLQPRQPCVSVCLVAQDTWRTCTVPLSLSLDTNS